MPSSQATDGKALKHQSQPHSMERLTSAPGGQRTTAGYITSKGVSLKDPNNLPSDCEQRLTKLKLADSQCQSMGTTQISFAMRRSSGNNFKKTRNKIVNPENTGVASVKAVSGFFTCKSAHQKYPIDIMTNIHQNHDTQKGLEYIYHWNRNETATDFFSFSHRGKDRKRISTATSREIMCRHTSPIQRKVKEQDANAKSAAIM